MGFYHYLISNQPTKKPKTPQKPCLPILSCFWVCVGFIYCDCHILLFAGYLCLFTSTQRVSREFKNLVISCTGQPLTIFLGPVAASTLFLYFSEEQRTILFWWKKNFCTSKPDTQWPPQLLTSSRCPRRLKLSLKGQSVTLQADNCST